MRLTWKMMSIGLLSVLAAAGPALAGNETPELAAVVDGQAITMAEIDAAIQTRLDALEQQKYEMRKGALTEKIRTILLNREAEQRGISLNRLKADFSAVDVQIPDEEVERAYRESADAFTGLGADEAKERIRIDLETAARVRKYRERVQELEKTMKVELFLHEPLRRMEVGDSPVAGNADAKVRVIMFTDYQCPFCRAADPGVRKLTETYRGDVALIVKHLPLEGHSMAMPAARAASCAAEQGRFWQFHEKVVTAPEVTEAALQSAGKAAGLDLAKFDECRRAASSEEAVLRDVRYASTSGINATPSYIINGKVLRGPTADALRSAIEQELHAGAEAVSASSAPSAANK